jgi:hypothetical protein
MMDYKQDDLATMMLRRQQGLDWPSQETVKLGDWESGKWSGMVFHIPQQYLLSPLPTTTEAQENLEDYWLTDPFTSAAPAASTDWARALWRERQPSAAIAAMQNEIGFISQQLADLKDEILRLQSLRAYVVPLTTLSAEFQLTQPIPVMIEGCDENFIASFTEANISASGETEGDAIANFKDSLVSSYQVLEGMSSDKLGPLPARQWKVLQNVVRRTSK